MYFELQILDIMLIMMYMFLWKWRFLHCHLTNLNTYQPRNLFESIFVLKMESDIESDVNFEAIWFSYITMDHLYVAIYITMDHCLRASFRETGAVLISPISCYIFSTLWSLILNQVIYGFYAFYINIWLLDFDT